MEVGEQPPIQTLRPILAALKIKNIQELLSNETLNIDNIAKTTNNHKLVVQEYLTTIQKQITKPFTSLPNVTIPLQSLFKQWLRNGSESPEEVKLSVSACSIVQIVGRSNGGKSYLLNQIIIETLKAGQRVIYLDNNENLEKLSFRIVQQLQQNSLKEEEIWFKYFQFKDLCELSILLHCIGNQLNDSNEPFFIFIDSLGRSEQPQTENHQSSSSIQFKFVDKFKRLLVEMAQKVGAIVYATKCTNSNALFSQAYKNEKQRPKWSGSTSKQWDSIADKTFCVDYTRTIDNVEYWRIISTKSPNTKLITLTRKNM